jgi:ankyrin repeat protein
VRGMRRINTLNTAHVFLCIVLVVQGSQHVLAEEEKNNDDVANHNLYMAARDGLLEEAKMQLAAGAEPDGYTDDNGRSALMYASIFGHFDLVHLLVDKGANITKRSKVLCAKNLKMLCA